MDSSIPTDGVPPDRVIALGALHRFAAMDCSDPAVAEWRKVPKYVSYNKSQPDRVCPFCGVQYLPLAEDISATCGGIERVEAERRLSGICSITCFRQAKDAFDCTFGRSAEFTVGDLDASVTAARAADGSVSVYKYGSGRGDAGKSATTISEGGTVTLTSLEECGRCSVGSSKGGRLSLCSACHGVVYCSLKCQREDWPRHKAACRSGKHVLELLTELQTAAIPSSLDGGYEEQTRDTTTSAAALLLPPTHAAGSACVVSGLVSRQDLNGCIAVVLSTPQTVVAPERLPVVVYGTTAAAEKLLLKPTNLRLLPCSVRSLDWNIDVVADREGGRAAVRQKPAVAQSVTILSLVADTPIGNLDTCHEFMDALQLTLRPPASGPLPPARLFSRAAIRAIIRAPSHEVFWMPFDSIGHYFVLEVQPGGSGRLFQSSVRSPVTLSNGFSTTVGYSPREWAGPLARPGWDAQLKATHSRWGGGRVLASAELAALLGAIADLQDAGDAVVAALLPQLDTDLVRGDEAYYARVAAIEAAGRSSGQRRGGVAIDGLSPLVEWTGAFMNSPGTISYSRAPRGALRIFSTGAYRGLRPFDICVPEPVVTAFGALFAGLTGQAPTPATFMALLHYRRWKTMRGPYNSGSGMGVGHQAVGWGFCETIHRHWQ